MVVFKYCLLYQDKNLPLDCWLWIAKKHFPPIQSDKSSGMRGKKGGGGVVTSMVES
jgi:hypothetical protein